jgi:hypothetical protein
MISLLHSSRGRPEQAAVTAMEWFSKATGEREIEYILSLDSDDPELFRYGTQFVRLIRQTSCEHFGLRIIIDQNPNVVAATNRAVSISKGDWISVVCDDTSCCEKWDMEIETAVQKAGKKLTDPWLLHVFDGIRTDIVTMPIMSRALCNKLGEHVFYPEYSSMYADDDITAVAKLLGVYIKDHSLLFQHRHWSNGMAKKDPTYLRTGMLGRNGRQIFEKRKADNFGVPR